MTKNTTCMGCHATINPLGFSLENYDAIGRWRTQENDKPINAASDFATDEGETIRLTGGIRYIRPSRATRLRKTIQSRFVVARLIVLKGQQPHVAELPGAEMLLGLHSQ